MNEPKNLLVVIVTYNSSAAIEECLENLAQLARIGDPSVEIIVTDNASGDATAELIQETQQAHPELQLKLVQSEVNLGWGAGNNLAIANRTRDPDYVLLCNPDAWIDKTNLKSLIAALEAHSPDGAIAVPFLQGDLGFVLGANPEWGVLKYLLWDYIGGRYPYRKFQTRYKDAQGAFEITAGYASGALALFTFHHLSEVGFFDERIFMFNDDIDITRSIVRNGGKLVGTRDAVAFHADGQGSRMGGDLPPGTTPASLARGSEFVFVEKWSGARRARVLAWYRWHVFYRVSNFILRAAGKSPGNTRLLRAPAGRYLGKKSGTFG